MKAQIWHYNSWIDETDPKILYEKYKHKLEGAGFDILNVLEHHFEPYGYTVLYLLGESHFAIHTFPEEKQSYIELSSCVKKQFDWFVMDVCLINNE